MIELDREDRPAILSTEGLGKTMSEVEGDMEQPSEPSPLVASLSGFQISLQHVLGRYYQDLETDLATWTDLNKVLSASLPAVDHMFRRRRRRCVPRSRHCGRRSRRG